MTTDIPIANQVVKRQKRRLTEIQSPPLRKDNEDIDKTIKHDTHRTRQILIGCVGCSTFLWLVFTALVVLMLGFQYKDFNLSDAVAIAFITTSLATVLGLLGIGLRFYFSTGK